MSILNVFPNSPNIVSTDTDGLMTSADKLKLDTVEKNANNYSHPATHSADIITETSTRKFMTQTEKDKLSSLSNTATQSANGLMSSTDKKKLDGIADNANNYTHPDSHPASMIIQTTTARFVTDTEKATWNAKASTAVATTSTNGLMSSTDKSNLDSALTRIATLESQYSQILAKLRTAVFYE